MIMSDAELEFATSVFVPDRGVLSAIEDLVKSRTAPQTY